MNGIIHQFQTETPIEYYDVLTKSFSDSDKLNFNPYKIDTS